MRRPTALHTPPAGTLPAPADNTSKHVFRQIGRATEATPVHEQVAREIAACHADPGVGLPFGEFADTGIITDDLVELITGSYSRTDGPSAVTGLRALRDYVMGCAVTTYHVGHNTAGYLPTLPPTVTLDRDMAVSCFQDLLAEAPDLLCGGDCDCDCGDDEACEYHTIEAIAKSFGSDAIELDSGSLYAKIIHDRGQPEEYFIHVSTMIVGEAFPL